ncbi:hypothetical protein BJ165DRAFT_188963 [Panaeolus papilionaceus]|nr:hypothetical protein BJ165DRAFT_188963 [Panaeolus papilionaceus]
MQAAYLVSEHLAPISDALVLLNTRTVHPVLFPFALAPTLHAARVSTIFQANTRRSPAALSWGTYIIGYLIMCWGGGLGSSLLLGLPPPMLYSFRPAVNYLTVHLVLTALFSVFPGLLNPKLLDTLLFPLDALLRTNAVTATLGLLYAPSVHTEYKDSPLMHMIIGAIASAGGGFTAGTLNLWSSAWAFGTPPSLKSGAGWAGTLDVWGGALVAAIYSLGTGHPAFAPFVTYLSIFTLSFLPASYKPNPDSDIAPLATLEAKSLAAAILTILFAARVAKTHWLSAQPIPAKPARQIKTQLAPSVAPTPKKAKKKVQ